MHIAVLGAGVVGVSTAYYLLDAGHDVTILDRDADLAQSCSFANGAQLSYSYVDAMASPAFLLRMPGLLAGIDRAIRVRPPISIDLIKWGLAFIGECTEKKAAANTLANLVLARRSKQLLDELRTLLIVHFAREQLPDGFYDILGERVEGRRDEIQALISDHGAILSTLNALLADTKTPDPDVEADVLDRLTQLLDQLHDHEHREHRFAVDVLGEEEGGHQ